MSTQTTKTQHDSKGASKPVVIGAAVGVLAVLILIAVLVAGGGEGTAYPQTRQVKIEGANLALLPNSSGTSSAPADPAIGQIAPTVSGQDFVGDSHTIGPDGKAKVIFIVAHWCSHCQKEVPEISDIMANLSFKASDGSRPDVYFISTAVGKPAGNYPASNWLAKNGFGSKKDSKTKNFLTDKIIVDDKAADQVEGASPQAGPAADAFGLSSYPFYVVLDGANKVTYRGAGEKPKSTLTSEINAALDAAVASNAASAASTSTTSTTSTTSVPNN